MIPLINHREEKLPKIMSIKETVHPDNTLPYNEWLVYINKCILSIKNNNSGDTNNDTIVKKY